MQQALLEMKMMVVVCILLLLVYCPISASNPSHSSQLQPANVIVHTHQRRVRRTLQSWMIRHRSNSNVQARAPTKVVDGTGSVLTVVRPTKDRIANWFGYEEDSDQILRSMLRKEFNHDSVGMTNPFLHIENYQTGEDDLLLSVQSDNLQITLPASSSNDLPASTKCWWPSLSFSPARKKEWRVLTYRQRVGQGKECYDQVRDAALDWEFQSKDGRLGMLSIPESSSSHLTAATQPADRKFLNRRSYSILSTSSAGGMDEPMAFHRKIGSFRRMVTYSSASNLPFFRRIYAVNPVMVVYDMVDQRAPGTTFTSTAYATMKGRLLRGEERVTVTLRDENEAVDVEIVSISKAGTSFKAKVVWPLIGRTQQQFFRKQMEALQEVANNASRKQELPRKKEKHIIPNLAWSVTS
eukprot:scaffold22583_cov106-Cylindrotheca_fusiformis.AAC.32